MPVSTAWRSSCRSPGHQDQVSLNVTLHTPNVKKVIIIALSAFPSFANPRSQRVLEGILQLELTFPIPVEPAAISIAGSAGKACFKHLGDHPLWVEGEEEAAVRLNDPESSVRPRRWERDSRRSAR